MRHVAPLAGALLLACSPPAPMAEAAPGRSSLSTSAPTAPGSQPAASSQPASAPTSQPVRPGVVDCGAQAELAGLDGRKPVPLQPMMAWHQKQNMMQHLVAVQRITDGLARGDYAAIAEAAQRIGSSPEMQQMCSHMGAGAPGFTEMALEFHRRADGIAEAARAQDATAVMQALSGTLQACTDCHATWRQDVVDAATWQTRTGSDHRPGR